MAEVYQVEGKSFIITGGANGLGAEYVDAFLKRGAKNIAILDIAEEAGVSLSRRLNEIYGDKTIFVKCDVSREEEINAAFHNVLNKFKQIDVIINNAGIMNDAENVWRTMCDVNWQGVVSFTRKGVNHMRIDEGGAGGTIVNISSIVGIFKLPILPAYCGSKAAVLHFSLSLAEPPFYERTGVRILTICFGPTQTSLLDDLVEKSVDKKSALPFLEQLPDTPHQSVDSAVAAMVKTFQAGSNGSVWLSTQNRSAEDITHVINDTYEKFENLVLNGLDSISN